MKQCFLDVLHFETTFETDRKVENRTILAHVRTMSILAKVNWQTVKPTIRERISFIFNNDLFSDVKFVVRGANGEGESKRRKQVIPAHKFVLSISSPVFEAMFYGELAETGDTIELPDCEHDSLLELFRYMYSDEVNLSGRNVMGVLYLAKKYMVPSLADKCAEYLQENLDQSNVFGILPEAQKYEEKNLVDQCWKVIDEQTEEAVKSDEFVTIEKSLLEAIVERDTLNIQEIELFKTVNLWAAKRCEEQGLSTDGSEKRRILGERIVKGIRFPVMTQHEFAAVVVDCKILSQDESLSLFKYFSSVPDTAVGFPEITRTGLKELRYERCRRYGSVVYTESGYSYSHMKDCLAFIVGKEISLLGVTLCGSKSNIYSVTVRVRNLKKKEDLITTTGTFPSVYIKAEPCFYYGFDIFFDRPVFLERNVMYGLEARISGANSCSCQKGKAAVVSSGVTFRFEVCCGVNNGTNVAHGQFPEILFTECQTTRPKDN